MLAVVLGKSRRQRDRLRRDVAPLECADFAAAHAGVNGYETNVAVWMAKRDRGFVDGFHLGVGEQAVAAFHQARRLKILEWRGFDEALARRPAEERPRRREDVPALANAL